MSLAFESLHGPGHRFPEQVSVAAPKGTKARIQASARAAGLTVSEFLRQCVSARLAPMALPVPTTASGSVTVAPERFADVRDEIGALWLLHWQEIGQDKDVIPLDPDWDRYAALDASGHLAIVTVRKGGALIGYAFAIVDTHLHYRSTLFAALDLYFILPAHRGGRTALRLFQVLEAELKARGVVKAVGNTKLAHDQGRLFAFLGWREAERLYVKTLGSN